MSAEERDDTGRSRRWVESGSSRTMSSFFPRTRKWSELCIGTLLAANTLTDVLVLVGLVQHDTFNSLFACGVTALLVSCLLGAAYAVHSHESDVYASMTCMFVDMVLGFFHVHYLKEAVWLFVDGGCGGCPVRRKSGRLGWDRESGDGESEEMFYRTLLRYRYEFELSDSDVAKWVPAYSSAFGMYPDDRVRSADERMPSPSEDGKRLLCDSVDEIEEGEMRERESLVANRELSSSFVERNWNQLRSSESLRRMSEAARSERHRSCSCRKTSFSTSCIMGGMRCNCCVSTGESSIPIDPFADHAMMALMRSVKKMQSLVQAGPLLVVHLCILIAHETHVSALHYVAIAFSLTSYALILIPSMSAYGSENHQNSLSDPFWETNSWTTFFFGFGFLLVHGALKALCYAVLFSSANWGTCLAFVLIDGFISYVLSIDTNLLSPGSSLNATSVLSFRSYLFRALWISPLTGIEGFALASADYSRILPRGPTLAEVTIFHLVLKHVIVNTLLVVFAYQLDVSNVLEFGDKVSHAISVLAAIWIIYMIIWGAHLHSIGDQEGPDVIYPCFTWRLNQSLRKRLCEQRKFRITQEPFVDEQSANLLTGSFQSDHYGSDSSLKA